MSDNKYSFYENQKRKLMAKNPPIVLIEKLKLSDVQFARKAIANRQGTASKKVDFHPQLVQVLGYKFSMSRILMMT